MKVTCPRCKRRISIKRAKSTKCKCGHKLEYMKFFKKKIDFVIYLIDANILIYADKKSDKRNTACKKILNFDSNKIKIGTTSTIVHEVDQNERIKLPEHIKIYKTGKLSDELTALKTNYLKQPSAADLSLIQAAIEHAEIKGIITYDKDFDRIATQGIVQKRSTSKFWLGTASQFLSKYEIKSKVKAKTNI